MKIGITFTAIVFITAWAIGCDAGKDATNMDNLDGGDDSVSDTASDEDTSVTGVDTETEYYEEDPVEPECIATCEQWDLLIDAVGCWDNCSCSTPCEAFAYSWVNCVLDDPLNMCMCDTYDILNCEGSFKDDEGTAACYDEYAAWYECADTHPPDPPEPASFGLFL